MKSWFTHISFGLVCLAIGGVAASQLGVLQLPSGPADAKTRELEDELVFASKTSFVGALGRIEPKSEILSIDAPAGDRVIALSVEENQVVESGDELARLESHDIRLAERTEIAARLKEARNQSATSAKLGNAKISKAEAQLKMVETLEPMRVETQTARIKALKADLEVAESEFVRSKALVGTIAVTEEEHDRKRLTAERQREVVRTAELTLAELQANQLLATEVAAAELEEARASLEQSLAAIPVESLESKVALAESQLQRTIIRAPMQGKILNIFTWPGERIGNEPILQMGDTSEMHAVAEVYETDVRHVRLGQRATIKSSALPEELAGRVVQIGSMIYKNDVLDVDPASDADARIVEVRIGLEQPEFVAALTNLQVDVLIDTTSVPGASDDTDAAQ